MTGRNLRLALPLLVAFVLLTPSEGRAQFQNVLQWFSGDLRGSRPYANAVVAGYGAQAAQPSGLDFRLTEYNLMLGGPVHRTDTSEWSLNGSLRLQDIRTDARLPLSPEAFPGSLWDLRFGGAYRQRFENGWIGGASVDFGSASDKPFYSWDEMTLSVNLFTRIPDGERNAWLVLLNYNNNREFLPHVPIPGVGYWLDSPGRYRVALGIPFLFAEIDPTEALTLRFLWLPIRTVHAGATYRLFKSLSVYGAFDWRNEHFFPADRADEDDRLFYYEKRLTAGFRFALFNRLSVDLSAGYAFDRFYFTGEDYSDRDDDRLDVDNGPFGQIRVGMRF